MSTCKTCDSSDVHKRNMIPDLVPCWDEFHRSPSYGLIEPNKPEVVYLVIRGRPGKHSSPIAACRTQERAWQIRDKQGPTYATFVISLVLSKD